MMQNWYCISGARKSIISPSYLLEKNSFNMYFYILLKSIFGSHCWLMRFITLFVWHFPTFLQTARTFYSFIPFLALSLFIIYVFVRYTLVSTGTIGNNCCFLLVISFEKDISLCNRAELLEVYKWPHNLSVFEPKLFILMFISFSSI